MKFQIKKASKPYNRPHKDAVFKEGLCGDPHWFIEIDTLEELYQLMLSIDNEIVLSTKEGDYNDIPLIVIYNDDYV